uniref:Wall-associated receptor kinase galacturonan-binding domain-containing protein n=1 Tax=Lactuca sativa TaxID=4236 RepID=A0A9R1XPJ8_LACSA|nr:hypothetical protein LSAT_V11C200072530 [Lactuca sativa]
MKLFQAYHLLIFLLLKTTSASDPKYTKPGCQVMCGDVIIPYPFGIGVNCSVSERYNVDCNRSTPYLPALNNVQVLEVNLEYQTVTVNVSMISDCHNLIRTSSQILGIELGESSPFLFSRLHNLFVVEGCGNAVILDQGTAVTGCSTTCRNESVGVKDRCLGITCCQTRLPYYLESYCMDLTGLERQGGDEACGSAYLVDKKSYDEGRFSSKSVAGDNTYIPISLLWTLSEREFSRIKCCSMGFNLKADTGNGGSIKSWKCVFPMGNKGSPYLVDGCYGIFCFTFLAYLCTGEHFLTRHIFLYDVLSDDEKCARCAEDGGECEYYDVYDDYDRISEFEFVCSHVMKGNRRHSKPTLSIH